MNISLFNSRFGSKLSTAIDYWTIRNTLGWNPLKHWQYLRNPKGRSHAEWCFGAEAGYWYLEWLHENNHDKYRKLVELSERQILDASSAYFKEHLEYEFNGISDLFEAGYISLMFSASEKDKCVRFKLIHKQSGKWTDYPVEGDLELEKKTIRRCADDLEGLPYNFKMLPGFLSSFNLITSSGKAKICSGVVTIIASWEHFNLLPNTGWPAVDPNLLDKYLSSKLSHYQIDEIPLRTP